MIPIKDEAERTMASIEQKEEEGEELEEEGEDDAVDEEECDDNSDEEQEGEDAKKKEEAAKPPACDEVDKSGKKKQAEGLNLNNEVVRMRKEVKRVRALIIRKLTRQIAALKKKKGKDAEIERNQRRAARLLEEIHAMKVLSPDLVTKTALQKKLDFEQECKNPKSTISDRAIARIATHPQFNKKIEDIKAAVKAFKEERMKDGKQGGKEKVQNKAGKMTLQSPPDKKGEAKSEIKEKDIPVDQEEIRDDDSKRLLEDTKDATVAEPEKSTDETTHSADTSDCQRREIPESKSLTPASIKSGEVKDIVKKTPQSKDAGKECDHKSAPETLHKKEDADESDLESSDDEEKEYFDDSTEERFHKQSSQSEESDDDDFFIGKVSKFKKKKQKNVDGEKVKKLKPDSADQVQSELDELESRLKSKVLQSVFCSSLSASKPGGGRGTGRGRGGDKFRGQGKTRGGSGLNRDFNKQSKFAKQEKGADRDQGSKYSKPESSVGFSPVGRGRGRGRGDFTRQKDHRGGGVLSHQAPQQALHPSWEASRKRKEQQGQILAFQGKKIKFDDDD